LYIREKLEKIKEWLSSDSFDAVYRMLAVIVALCLVFSYIMTKKQQNVEKPENIQVYVKGEVINPGVYTLDADSRIQQLIDAAGGLTTTADIDDINLSEKVIDEEVIIIPKLNENTNNGLVNINTATVEQLDALPGIGEGYAKRIVEYREKYGKFKKKEYIMNVKGIGQSLFDKFKDMITV